MYVIYLNIINININSYIQHIFIFRQDIFSKEPGFEGFHLFSGSHYVYPSNYPIREYQMEIIKTALFNNTLIILPAGKVVKYIISIIICSNRN